MVDVNLVAKPCTPCQGGVPPMQAAIAADFLAQIPSWILIDGATKLKRHFQFADFIEAQAFVNKVADLCEAEGHHADISFGWCYAKIIFQTHKIQGLHENDFIMAAKVSALFA